MSKDNLEILFKDLENEFDIENPKLGHQQRFLDKLNTNKNEFQLVNNKRPFWKPLIGIAASLLLLSFVFITTQQNSQLRDLASISPEMAETQDFYTTTITSELERLEQEISPEYQDLVVDAMFQIKILEENYELLKADLNDSGDDKRVIYAMISNFQSRIELLQNVLEQIDNIKQENSKQNENSFTL